MRLARRLEKTDVIGHHVFHRPELGEADLSMPDFAVDKYSLTASASSVVLGFWILNDRGLLHHRAVAGGLAEVGSTRSADSSPSCGSCKLRYRLG